MLCMRKQNGRPFTCEKKSYDKNPPRSGIPSTVMIHQIILKAFWNNVGTEFHLAYIAFFSHKPVSTHMHTNRLRFLRNWFLYKGQVLSYISTSKLSLVSKWKKKISEWIIWTCIFNLVHHFQDIVESVVPNPCLFHLSCYTLSYFRRNCWQCV